MARAVPVLLGLAGVAFGLWLLACGVGDAFEAARSGSWPTAPGEITESWVKIRSGNKGSSYEPHITYIYTVAGAQHSGDAVSPGRIWTRSSSYDVVQAYPKGAHPAIPYSPSDPNHALLVPGLHLANFTVFTAAVLVLSFATPFALTGIFGAADPVGKPGNLSLPKSSPLCRFVSVLIVSVFLEFGFLWWLISG